MAFANNAMFNFSTGGSAEPFFYATFCFHFGHFDLLNGDLPYGRSGSLWRQMALADANRIKNGKAAQPAPFKQGIANSMTVLKIKGIRHSFL